MTPNEPPTRTRPPSLDQPTVTVRPDDPVPNAIGPYTVVGELGRGGMGVVYQGEDPKLKRAVAIKLIKGVASEVARERFLREAQAVAAIDHPNVIPVYAAGEHDGQPYVVMPLLVGKSLSDKLKAGGRLPLPEVVRIGRQIALGLDAAHKQNIIHRDIKPGNVFLVGADEQVRVLDFGLARFLDPVSGSEPHIDHGPRDPLTGSGMVLGTPSYMSPEQARGEPVDHRTDLFSLGVVLYQMAAGTLPFAGRTWFEVVAAILSAPTPNVRQAAPTLPAAFVELVEQLLAKDPADRPANATEVVRRLDSCLDPHALPTERPAPKPRRPLWPWTAGGVAALMLLGVGGWLLKGVLFPDPVVAKTTEPDRAVPQSEPTGSPGTSKQPDPSPQPRPEPDDRQRAVAEWVLNRGGKVTVLAGETKSEVAKSADLPDGAFHLVGVRLAGDDKLTDADLERLTDADRLASLDLSGTRISGEGLKHLKARKLRVLHLTSVKLSPNGMQAVGEFTHLRELNLSGAEFQPNELRHLAKLDYLRKLDLTKTTTDNDALKHLEPLTWLGELHLENTAVTDAAARKLCEKLRACTAHTPDGKIAAQPTVAGGAFAAQVTKYGDVVAYAASSSVVEWIRLDGRTPNRSGRPIKKDAPELKPLLLRAIPHLTRLKGIVTLGWTGVLSEEEWLDLLDDVKLEPLVAFTADCDLTPRTLARFKRMNLSDQFGCSVRGSKADDVRELLRHLTETRVLEFKGLGSGGPVDAAGWAGLAECKAVELAWTDCSVTPEVMARVTAMRRVSRLTFQDCTLSAEAVRELQPDRDFSLTLQNVTMTEEAVRELANKPGLTGMTIQDCKITSASVREVLKARPFLRVYENGKTVRREVDEATHFAAAEWLMTLPQAKGQPREATVLALEGGSDSYAVPFGSKLPAVKFELTTINLYATPSTEDVTKYLLPLGGLRNLLFQGPDWTDQRIVAVLTGLKGMPLDRVFFKDCEITDAALVGKHLSGLTKLRTVTLEGEKTKDPKGVAKALAAGLPDCWVEHWTGNNKGVHVPAALKPPPK